MESGKVVTDEPICRAGIEIQMKKGTSGHRRGRGGGVDWEIRTDTYILPCGK